MVDRHWGAGHTALSPAMQDQGETLMKHISEIIKRVMQSIKVEDKTDPDPRCWECGKPGDYYDGVCYECAAQPYGLLWQLEQGEP